MLTLNLAASLNRPLSVLCLGAHSDDIEIGCGGTLLHLRNSCPQLELHWVVFSGLGARGDEARNAARLFAADCVQDVQVKDFRDGFLPYSGTEIKECFEELKMKVSPDLIFTHWNGDAHQDHRLICELTWNTFRNHMILEYEIPKYDGDMGRPDVFVPLDDDTYRRKVDYLVDIFRTQHTKSWFDKETFLSLMRLRGMECAAPTRYAEAFYSRKLVLQ